MSDVNVSGLSIGSSVCRYVTEKPVEVVVDPNYIYFNRIFENFQVRLHSLLFSPHTFSFADQRGDEERKFRDDRLL